MKRPIIVAHRGLHDLHIENTLAAFRAAWHAGVEWCECDVRGSIDRTPFVIHDETVDRTFPSTGRVADTTAEALVRLGVPTLGEVLAGIPATGRLLVEIKSPVSGRVVESAVRMCDPSNGVIQSFDADVLRLAAEARSDLPLEILVDDAATPVPTGPWRAVNAGFRSLNADTVSRLRDRGLGVGAWTVNADADIRRIVALGVDTIITDNPLRAHDIGREIG